MRIFGRRVNTFGLLAAGITPHTFRSRWAIAHPGMWILQGVDDIAVSCRNRCTYLCLRHTDCATYCYRSTATTTTTTATAYYITTKKFFLLKPSEHAHTHTYMDMAAHHHIGTGPRGHSPGGANSCLLNPTITRPPNTTTSIPVVPPIL